MKKILLILAILCPLCIFAQDGSSTSSAIELTESTTTFRLPDGTTANSGVYYKYTATESQLLSITGSSPSFNVNATDSDGNYISTTWSSDYMTTTLPVAGSTTVYLSISTSSDPSTFTYTLSHVAADVDGGKTESDPIVAPNDGSSFYIPGYYNNSELTYISYTVPEGENGVLVLNFPQYVYDGSIKESTASTSESFTASYAANYYTAKVSVEAGKTYIITAGSYYAGMGNFVMTYPKKGDSYDYAFDGAATNTLPAAAGTYWYQYTPDVEYMIVNSDTEIKNCTISLHYTSYGSLYSQGNSVSGFFGLRESVYSGTTYYLKVEKSEATEADETFNIKAEAAQQGDSNYNPIILSNNEFTTPIYNGTYYYQLTTPSDWEANKWMTINIADTQNSNIRICTSSGSQLASGYGSAKTEATANTTYIFEIAMAEGKNEKTATITYEEVKAGETCSMAIEAENGTNNLAASSPAYYNYTATQTGWLAVTPAVSGITVTFPQSCDQYASNYDVKTSDNTYKIQATEGTSYIIKLEGATEATTFTVAEEDFAEGESCAKPIAIQAGSTTIATEAGTTWYSFTATQDGMVEIESNIADYTSGYNDIQVGDCNSTSSIKSYDNSTYSYTFTTKKAVTAGDVVLIKVISTSAQTDVTLTVSIRDWNAGEACSKPIELTAETTTITLDSNASNSQPVWYSANLSAGEFKITSSNWFNMELYNSCDGASALAYSTYSYDYNTYVSTYYITYTVTEPGVYFIKCTGNYGQTATVTGNFTDTTGVEDVAASDNAISVVDGKIAVNADSNVEVVIYNTLGQVVLAKNIAGAATFEVESGAYIVRAGDNVKKVYVK